MKPITKQSDKKTAFTIIELLTVMSIIVILIGLLLPSLNMVKRYAKEVRQKAQFHSIEAALELFSGEQQGTYPSSIAKDDSTATLDYCGAMRLCEAMVGQDLAGFNPNSHFWANCTVNGTDKLYDNPPVGAPLWPNLANPADNLKARKSYLQADNANAYRLRELYGTGNTAPFSGDSENLFVLCDVYNRVKNHDTGKSIGMPILYYKANISNTKHDPNDVPTPADDKGQIYNYLDNDALVNLGPTGVIHPLNGATTNFYEITKDDRITITTGRPYRPDSYILISAGFDGIYGTNDDIFNFEK
jgi:type II secretory pathway pseudopilin PulG